PALRILNVLIAGVAILLVARLAERVSPGTGAFAAFLYAFAPWEIVTSARSMAESPAWLLALVGSNLLLVPPDARRRWAWMGGAALAVACMFRYEAWLLGALVAARAAVRAWTS